MTTTTLPPDLLRRMHASWRACNQSCTWLSTNTATDTLRFSSAGGLKAIGGSFFGSDVDGLFLPGVDILLQATDGSGVFSHTLTAGTLAGFTGFVSDGRLQSLTLRALQPAAAQAERPAPLSTPNLKSSHHDIHTHPPAHRWRSVRPGGPRVVTAALPNGQAAACWIAVSPNGRFAFSANAGNSTISSFGISRDGRLNLLSAQGATTGTNAGALDMAVSPDGQQLHVFAHRAPQLVTYTIGSNGQLTLLGNSQGTPLGSAGMAAN